MSVQYAKYLDEHIANVHRAYNWIKTNLPELVKDEDYGPQMRYHDYSKYDTEEYSAYDVYFYGNHHGREKTQAIKDNFNKAWLHHIHNNPHHWQHWILINDDPGEGMVILDMPHNYIIEMICDWWAFSWKSGNLNEIFNWYGKHKDYMKLSDNTRATVEDILNKIKNKLEENMED